MLGLVGPAQIAKTTYKRTIPLEGYPTPKIG
jgi:hypothetical protein